MSLANINERKLRVDTWRGMVSVADDASRKWRRRVYWNVRMTSIERLKRLFPMTYLGNGVYFGVIPREPEGNQCDRTE